MFHGIDLNKKNDLMHLLPLLDFIEDLFFLYIHFVGIIWVLITVVFKISLFIITNYIIPELPTQGRQLFNYNG